MFILIKIIKILIILLLIYFKMPIIPIDIIHFRVNIKINMLNFQSIL
jgi:hypothetical protein